MIFVRRDRRGAGRFTNWRVGLFFLAAGVWLAGLITERSLLTAAAIGIVVVALLLGILDRPTRGE